MSDCRSFVGSKPYGIASRRTPEPDSEYYLFIECVDGEVSFYSKAVGWRSDCEVRVPRLVSADEMIDYFQRAGREYLVLEEISEFKIWMQGSDIPALVKREIWGKYIEGRVEES